jgi:hypothetical protein
MKNRYKVNYFPMGYMDVKLFTDIIDQLPEGTEVDFHKDGEPLLHPHIGWMIAYAKGKGMYTHLVTNGLLLNKKKDEIVDSGLDLLTISIVDEIPYDSINSFMEFKRGKKPIAQLKLYCRADDLPKSDRVIHRQLHNWTDDTERKSRKACSKLLNAAAVNWDGGYALCCVDYKRELVPFNVKEVPIKQCLEFSRLIYDWQMQGTFIAPCTNCNYWEG